jgi:hypothetical protein
VTEAVAYFKSQPTQEEMVTLVAARLRNESSSADERLSALSVLLDLSSSLDVANDLHTLGALSPTLEQLKHDSAAVRALAAQVLGVAASNNAPVCRQVAELRGADLLALRFANDETETRLRAVYALSSLARACPEARAQFLAAGGAKSLRAALLNDGSELLLRKRALVFLTDLGLLSQLARRADEQLFAALVAMLRLSQHDADLAEKALLAMQQSAACEAAQAALRGAGAVDALEVLKDSLERQREAEAAEGHGDGSEPTFTEELLALRLRVAEAVGAAGPTPANEHDEL